MFQDSGETSVRVRRARDGDAESVAWVVERFTPALVAQARYRLGRIATPPCDPEDLVAEVWAVALPRLPEVRAEDRRATPVLVAFLASTLLNLYNNLVRKVIRRKALGAPAPRDGASDDVATQSGIADPAIGVVSEAVRHETAGILWDLLTALPETDRDIVILRAIEQTPTKDVAARLGLSPKSVSQRYNRALARLRDALPQSFLRDLDQDADVV